jgi:acetyltransferase-like isoleucine patch superfamily enzyme
MSSIPQIAACCPNPALVFLGEYHELDPGVLIGYPPAREISSLELRIGDRARLRAGTVIYLGSTIGARLETGHHVVIREENRIGEEVRIWNNSIIDYGCRIGNNVKIHCNCYVAQYTVIEDDVFLAPGVVIANDPHPGCRHSARCMKGPTIKKGAQVGCNVTILPFITIGEGCLIGAGSVVTRSLPPFTYAYGNPARVVGSVQDIRCSTGIKDRPYPEG